MPNDSISHCENGVLVGIARIRLTKGDFKTIQRGA